MEEINKAIGLIDRFLYEVIRKDRILNLDSLTISRMEKKFQRALKILFKGWENRIKARLQRKVFVATKSIGFSEVDEVIAIIQASELNSLMLTYMKTSGMFALTNISDIAMAAGLSTKSIEWFKMYCQRTSSKIVEDVKGRIAQQIMVGIQRGDSVTTIGRNIKGVFTSLQGYEAERIARTEVVRGYNEGYLDGLMSMGETLADVIQVDPCPICTDNAITYPKDISQARGDFPAHPNCRCEIIKYIK